MSMQKLLERFVATDNDPRIHLRSVLAMGDYLYASNGAIAVRAPTCDGVQAIEYKPSTDWAAIFDRLRLADGFEALPVLPHGERCPSCTGTGIAYRCPDCNGEGEFERGGNTYDCKECCGSGQVAEGIGVQEPCVDCDGSGEKKYQRVPIGNTGFDLRYLKKIADLPGLKFATNPDDSEAAAYFVWDGGDGLLMPLCA